MGKQRRGSVDGWHIKVAVGLKRKQETIKDDTSTCGWVARDDTKTGSRQLSSCVWNSCTRSIVRRTQEAVEGGHRPNCNWNTSERTWALKIQNKPRSQNDWIPRRNSEATEGNQQRNWTNTSHQRANPSHSKLAPERSEQLKEPAVATVREPGVSQEET